MLLRLNQELFPEPGRPMASITVPLGFRGTDGTTGAGSPPEGLGALSVEASVRRNARVPAASATASALRIAPVIFWPRAGRIEAQTLLLFAVQPLLRPLVRWLLLASAHSTAGRLGAVSKYAGCKGVGDDSAGAFSAGFLRRLRRSAIHLRILGL